MTTLKAYRVVYSARKVGAIGIFYPVPCNVMAKNEDDAKTEAFRILHLDGYETNHPISVHATGKTAEVNGEN